MINFLKYILKLYKYSLYKHIWNEDWNIYKKLNYYSILSRQWRAKKEMFPKKMIWLWYYNTHSIANKKYRLS